MKFLYPASYDIPSLTESQLSLKISRHSPCSVCASESGACDGLWPPPNVVVILDNAKGETASLGGTLADYGSSDDDEGNGEGTDHYLDTCGCGHTVAEHGASISELGTDEWKRRGRVAVRLDEQLQDIHKLLDFDYSDDDITSLRLQMKPYATRISRSSQGIATPTHSSPVNEPLSPASSILSDVPGPPPSKRRRISISSLSDAGPPEIGDSDSDDEDKPLAARISSGVNASKGQSGPANAASASDTVATTLDTPSRIVTKTSNGNAGKRSGKSKSKSQGQMVPASIQPPTGRAQAQMNGTEDMSEGAEATKVKMEDKMDDGQLDRLATGVTVDAVGGNSAPSVRTEKICITELRTGVIQFAPARNDGAPRNLIILTGLKTLFQRQLPKMPREYIARLVYDRNSRGLAIVKRGLKVVGGICFRPFEHRGFAEIVFLATTSADQDKGYGSLLMDNFKQHIQATYPGMKYFLTYADNFAVGYFRKQGFSKDITLERAIWAGYIKDYEGANIMQCTLLDKVDYTDKVGIVKQQREAVLDKIREKSRSHVIYEGLAVFKEGGEEGAVVDPKDVPGLRESGWTVSMATSAPLVPRKNAEHTFMHRLLNDLQGHPQAWAFLQPVNGNEVEDYYDVIKRPMDLNTMEHKLETNQYPSLRLFIDDARLIFDNCRLYNPEGTIYHKNAAKMDKFLMDEVAERMKTEA